MSTQDFFRARRVAAIARDMLGAHELGVCSGIGSGGRPRLLIRLMASLLYPKNSLTLGDEELVVR